MKVFLKIKNIFLRHALEVTRRIFYVKIFTYPPTVDSFAHFNIKYNFESSKS